jgi:NAD(P)H dehydrogenase (quinone)
MFLSPEERPMSGIDVLVTGGTGNVGRQALQSLLGVRGLKVRALVRDPGKTQWISALGGEIVQGDLDDTASVARALRDVKTLLFISPPSARSAEQANPVVTLAKQAGVQKIVRLSAIKASEDGPTDNTRQHALTERAIRESGMRYVFLRPNYFMQNLLGSLDSIVREGKLYAGMADAGIALIDARDVGDALAAAALTDRFDGSALELSGPKSITHDEVAAAIGSILGRNVAYVALPPESVGESLRTLGVDDWTAQLIVDYSRAYTRGFGDFVTDSVQQVTGHAPRNIATFAAEVILPRTKSMAPR